MSRLWESGMKRVNGPGMTALILDGLSTRIETAEAGKASAERKEIYY